MLPKILKLFGFENTRYAYLDYMYHVLQIRVVRTKFDIYVFITECPYKQSYISGFANTPLNFFQIINISNQKPASELLWH